MFSPLSFFLFFQRNCRIETFPTKRESTCFVGTNLIYLFFCRSSISFPLLSLSPPLSILASKPASPAQPSWRVQMKVVYMIISQELLNHTSVIFIHLKRVISTHIFHVCKERYGIALGPAQEKGEARSGEGWWPKENNRKSTISSSKAKRRKRYEC